MMNVPYVALCLTLLAPIVLGTTLVYTGPDTGHAENCGNSSFQMEWTPKVVSSHRPVTIKMNFTAPHNVKGGYLNATAMRQGQVFFHDVFKFTCHDIQLVLQCPMKQSQTVQLTKTVDTTGLRSFPGHFHIVLDVKNEKNQEILCAKLDLTIQD